MSELSTRLAADLDEAFPAFVDAFGSAVYSLTTRLLDREVGEDIAQETFLNAYRSLAGSTPPQIEAMRLRPWVLTIATNLVRNEYRRRARHPVSPIGSADDADVDLVYLDRHSPDSTSLPEAMVDARQALDWMDGALSTLSFGQREAVVLRHIVGLSTAEVSELLKCPEGTVKSHLSRGLAALRVLLSDAEEERSEIDERNGS